MAKSPKVLRLAVVVDDLPVDELHQEKPGSISVGRGIGNTVNIFDGHTTPKDYKKLAPIWLAVGAIMLVGGIAMFAQEVVAHAAAAAEIKENLLPGAKFEPKPHVDGTTGGWGAVIAIIGFFPLLFGWAGLRDPKARPSRHPGKVPPASSHKLFDYSGGRYFLDLPGHAKGKISLGKKTYTVGQLRKKFNKPRGNLRIELSTKARGKLRLGESTLLFQFDKPKAVPRRFPFPVEFRPRIDQMVGREDAASLASAALVLGSYFTWAANTPVDPSFSVDDIDDRFVRVMGLQEEEEEVPEEDVDQDELAQEDEEKVEVKDEPEKELQKKPEKFSDKAMAKARGVGIARVLGTYGGDGPGEVFDVIQSTENQLGELFDKGMTTTVLADGGDLSPFVPGGEGITAHGAMAENAGLETGDGPDVAKEGKKERRIRGKLKTTGTDIFGDVDKKAVQATIRRRMSALQHCYEKALRTQPDLQGKMTYTISISVMGSVTRVSIEEDTVGSPSVTACTKGKIKGWRFPMAGAEEPAEVTFNVVFSGGA